MTALCSLTLEVYSPPTSYDPETDVVEWEVSNDPAHPYPYLISPRNYAEQEIDPVQCSATIGTIEVGVIDPATISGDQTSGWMTARVFNVFGRRCRLRRFINDTIGWVTIADGPAGAPRMDASYSAYRWTIRDTRDTERKLKAFTNGGTTAIVPRGAINGFGKYYDDTDTLQYLLPPLSAGIPGVMVLSELGDGSGRYTGFVSFDAYLDSTGIPFGDPPNLTNDDLIIDEDGEKALEPSSINGLTFVHRNADVLWRAAGTSDPWNVSRPSFESPLQPPLATVRDVVSTTGESVRAVEIVWLFLGTIPAGFPANGASVEIILRYRGPASTTYPYYFEGTAGDLLKALYDRQLIRVPAPAGSLYDPDGLELVDLTIASHVRYDAAALAAMTTAVLLRQTEPVDDGRAWSESKIYGPSGWIATLDLDGQISPTSRNRPASLVGLPAITSAISQPSADWNSGDRVVTEILYTYRRYWIPTSSSVTTEPDGLALRDVELEFQDPDAEVVHNVQIQEYDASVFSSVGTDQGEALSGVPETSSVLAQEARFEVLERYRNGAQSFPVAVLRDQIPTLRVGEYVTWDLLWIPNRGTGFRGGPTPEDSAAQVLAIRDNDCVWRALLLEESAIARSPGFYTDLTKTDDDLQPGYYTDLGLTSDTLGGS